MLLLALFCAPLVTHVYLGSYSRFIADDFCSAAIARSRGIFGGTLYWYVNWSGRYSANFLDSLFGYLGPAFTPFATGLVVALWFIVLAIAVANVLPAFEKREAQLFQSGLIAAAILFAVLHLIPFVGQSLYWGQGMRSVVPPLILGTACVALIANRVKSSPSGGSSPLWSIMTGLLTFVAVGFAETYFALQTAAILFAVIIPGVFKHYAPDNRRTYFVLLIAGLAGSLVGGLLMIVAPGNEFRRSAYPPPPALPELLAISFRGVCELFELVVLAPNKWLIWVGLIFAAFIFGLRVSQSLKYSASPLRHVYTLIWLPVAGFVLLLSCVVPMAWATSQNLAYRTLIIPAYVLVCLVVCWAYIAGQVCRNAYILFAHRAPTIATALPLVGLLAFGVLAAKITHEMLQQRSTFAGYARRLDEREQMIQHAKTQGLPYAVVLRQHNWAALEEIAVDPKITWLTKCVQEYYGIGVIPDLGDLYGEPDGVAKQAALERQFDSIPKLPGSVPTRLNEYYKTDRGKIGFYKSEESPTQIKSYYQHELERLGWKYIGEKKVEAYRRLTGGTQNLFCNGEVAATLFITAEDEARLGYTYSIALNWGMSSGYKWGEVDCVADR